MLIDNINLNHIRIFESVYRSKSMTKAADELHITQSGVSQHIKHLESILGIVLFDRIKQRLLPTNSADQFYQSCKDGLSLIETALQDIKGVRPNLAGSLKMGLPNHFYSKFFHQKLGQFQLDNPEIKLNLQSQDNFEILSGIQNGDIDLALLEEEFISPGIQAHASFEIEFDLFCTLDFIQRHSIVSIDKKNITELPFITMKSGENHLKRFIQKNFKLPNPRLNIHLHTPDWTTLISFVSSGLGLALIPRDLILDYSNIHIHKIDDSMIKASPNNFITNFHFISLTDRCLKDTSKEFVNLFSFNTSPIP